MLLRNLFITIALLSAVSCNTHKCNYVKITDQEGKKEGFTFADTSKTELVNDYLNIAVISKEASLLQLNHLSINLLKDTSLTSSDVEVVLIDRQKNYTYKSNSIQYPVALKVECTNNRPGTHFRIYGKVQVYYNAKLLWIKMDLNGTIPQPQFIRTY